MSLLLFLGREGGFDGWLLLEEGLVAARGHGLDGAPPPSPGLTVAGIVPGEEVTLHWLDLPIGLAPAQAAAAARLAVAAHSAQSLADVHVAVGPERGEAPRCVALCSHSAMAEWLVRIVEPGYDPGLLLPETLLLPEPEQGLVRHDRGALSVYRGPAEAFALEPNLAGLVLAGRDAPALDADSFEAGLAEAIGRPAVNLRQGPFARRRRLQVDKPLVRRLALLTAAILFASLAIQLVAILRYTFAADALEREARLVAAHALPRNAGITDPSAELGVRLTELRGGGIGFTAIAAPVFAAVKSTANAEISALAFSPDGSLKVTVQADSPATIATLSERIEAAGFAVEEGVLRGGGGRQVSDLMVRPR
jgi:general secretion pathway protein L